MPDQDPNNAPDHAAPVAQDEDAAKTIVPDTETRPGGGSLFGASAAEATQGASATDGAAPNAPIDVPTPHDTDEAEAPGDAARQAGERAPEPRPQSQ